MAYATSSLPLLVGLRYTLSRRSNRFISVVSAISMLGLAIGVASLIVVLSVMNGFAGELRGRILAVVPHAFVGHDSGQLADWQSAQRQLETLSGVLGAAPYLESKVLMRWQGAIMGAAVTAIDAQAEQKVSEVAGHMLTGELSDLDDTRFGVIVGSLLLDALGADVGDRIELIFPQFRVTPLGTFPRSKRFTVIGRFQVGAQLDSQQAFIALGDGQKVLGTGDRVHGLRVRLDDLFSAPERLGDLRAAVGEGAVARDWTTSQGSLFQSIKMEKIMIGVLLMCVIGVAAFNIVSTLSMAVAEKRGDIAVLRTMGLSSARVTAIFLVQGMTIAGAGITVGATLGVLLASYISPLATFLERSLGLQVFDPQVYFIAHIPSVLDAGDVMITCLVALMLSLLAAAYPAWRASRIAPAEVLRYAI